MSLFWRLSTVFLKIFISSMFLLTLVSFSFYCTFHSLSINCFSQVPTKFVVCIRDTFLLWVLLIPILCRSLLLSELEGNIVKASFLLYIFITVTINAIFGNIVIFNTIERCSLSGGLQNVSWLLGISRHQPCHWCSLLLFDFQTVMCTFTLLFYSCACRFEWTLTCNLAKFTSALHSWIFECCFALGTICSIRDLSTLASCAIPLLQHSAGLTIPSFLEHPH